MEAAEDRKVILRIVYEEKNKKTEWPNQKILLQLDEKIVSK
jgi:hypothetical protein